MRATRALLASLGASTCLVLAGTMGLAGLSTLVAFQGWPGTHVQTFVADQALLSGAAQREPRAMVTPAPPVRHAPARAVVRPAPARPIQRVGASTLAPAVRRVGSPRTPSPHAHVLQSADPVAQALSAPAPKAAPAPKLKVDAAAPVRRIGAAVGAGVADTTSHLGDVVRPVSPGVGQVLDDTGRVAGGTVAGLSDVVAALLAGLTPAG